MCRSAELIDEIEALGYGENTLIFYIWGDNGSSSEGQNGTISELIAQNGIPTTVKQHMAALEALGGLDALGTPLTDNQYHGGVGVGRQHPLQGHEAARLALRWHAQPDGDPLAGKDQTGLDAAPAVSPLQRSGPHHLRDRRYQPTAGSERRTAGSHRRRELRLFVR